MLWSMKKLGYRSFHRVMKTVGVVMPFPVPTVLSGPESLEELARQLAQRGHERVLVVTDEVLVKLGLVKRLLDALDDQGVAHTIFDTVPPNPSIEVVEQGRAVYLEAGCDAVVGFGGGSPMDAAKIIAARVGNGWLSVRGMKGLFKVVLPIPPIYCVPTTAGTGSETTVTAVISDKQRQLKFAISDLKLVPKIAVLDPTLMVGLPHHITAATGMDALTHAVEAFIGLNGNRFTDEMALEATELVFTWLERAYAQGDDLEAREKMARASFCGGAAFTRVYVGYVHAIAHQLGGLYGVPHGLANAIVLPVVLDACQVEAQPKLAALARAAKLEGDSEQALARAFIAEVRRMNQAMGIPATVKELREQDVGEITRRALSEAHPEYPVPRLMDHAELEGVVRSLLA
jgi:alcohol dehydrogenase